MYNTINKNLLIFSLGGILLFGLSCNNDISNHDIKIENNKIKEKNEFEYKKELAIALAKAIKNDVGVRKLIKENALLKFNKDYDVLYHTIKNTVIHDTITLRDKLIESITEQDLNRIEQNFPLLTIFVPKLFNNSFSAELWNINKDTPSVAVESSTKTQIYLFDSNGDELILKANEVPALPVVLLKDNERIVVKESFITKSGLSEFKYDFIDPFFDNSLKKEKPQLRLYPTDQRVLDAV